MPSRTPVQLAYEAMLSDHVRPLLAAHDFKKSGPNFRRRWSGGWHVINFQKSQWSDRGSIRFTFNVGVTFNAFERFEGRNPKRPPTEPTCPWRSRPWHFFEDPPDDDWWTIESPSDAKHAARAITGLMTDGVLPALDHLRSTEDLLRSCRRRSDQHWLGLCHKPTVMVLLHADQPAKFRRGLADLRLRAARTRDKNMRAHLLVSIRRLQRVAVR